ncbi:MAG: sel1 repeat family protein [Nitrosomonadales bacterium]|nr:sel1 repeat family protein [Nitrosomonadales bacterium]
MRIVILMLLLTIAGCGEKPSDSKTETGAPPEQKTNLASQFFAGPLSPEAKFAEVKQKAESGNAKDQLGLARRYYAGDGVTKDNAKAAEWYRKAAEQGNAFAQYKLGEMYDKGEGVPKDAAKAVEWWQKAAAQGDEAAQESLKHPPANEH